MSIEEVLVSVTSNPLLLLAVGAGISGVLVPYFTRKWQDGQKELELKLNLIERIGTSVTSIIRATESIENQSNKVPLEEKKSWDNACPIIGAHINTYFHRSKRKIPAYWEKYKNVVDKFCLLFEKDDQKDRESILNDIISYVNEMKTKTPYNIEENKPILVDKDHNEYIREMENLRKKIFDMKHELMKNIIESSMAGFSSKFSQRFS